MHVRDRDRACPRQYWTACRASTPAMALASDALADVFSADEADEIESRDRILHRERRRERGRSAPDSSPRVRSDDLVNERLDRVVGRDCDRALCDRRPSSAIVSSTFYNRNRLRAAARKLRVVHLHFSRSNRPRIFRAAPWRSRRRSTFSITTLAALIALTSERSQPASVGCFELRGRHCGVACRAC